MEIIRVSDSLAVEVHPARGKDQPGYLVIKAVAAGPGGGTGQVFVSPSELSALRDALAQAAARLAATEADERDDAEISLQAAAELFELDHWDLMQAALAGRLAARRSGLSWRTTRWAVREALADGRLRPR
jgi:hypothetical protein